MKSLVQSKNAIFKKIPQMLAFSYIVCFILLPTTTIFAVNKASIFQESNISQKQCEWFEKIGDQGLYGKGFGLNTNIATRGMTIYKNELYIGIENLNKSKLKSYFPHLVSKILIEIVKYNIQLLKRNTIKEIIDQIYKLVQDIINTQPEVVYIPQYYWNENYKGYSYSPDRDNQFILEPEAYCLGGLRQTILNKFARLRQHYRTFFSDGGEMWKYNYSTNSWTQIIGAHSITGINAGFNYHFNCAISVIKEFKGELYAGTWSTPIGSLNNPDRKGCEIWRYDGNLWEQVVGSDAHNDYGRPSGGFGNPDNIAAWSIEEFNGYLYIGTMNWNRLETGACEIWRSYDGINWERVVDHGFRLNMTEQDIKNGVMNNYAWIMKNYSCKLYVGTFNSRGYIGQNLQGAGCQLWSSANGVTWIKEPLPNGDGFGEGANWGIRSMDIYNGDLYIGTATNFKSENEGCEIWRYNVSGEQKVWTCIVGDQASTGKYTRDGFNDTANKYVWSMIVTADGLYAGTSNRNGCQVYRYNITSGWTALVKTRTSEEFTTEKPDGFGDCLNYGVRSMIEYPLNSKNVFLGTFTSYWHKLVGCEIWVRYA